MHESYGGSDAELSEALRHVLQSIKCPPCVFFYFQRFCIQQQTSFHLQSDVLRRMLRNFSSLLHRELLRITPQKCRVNPVVSQINKSKENKNKKFDDVNKLDINNEENLFYLRFCFDSLKRKIYRGFKYDGKFANKDDFLIWCTGVLCLSSVIVGHKWLRGNQKKECPIQHVSKEILQDLLLTTKPNHHLVFAINPDPVRSTSQKLVKSSEDVQVNKLDAAVQNFQGIAEECNASLLNRLAIKLAEANKHKQAFELYKESSALGNTTAVYNMGISYEHGLGVKKSNTKAAECFEKAGSKDHVKSLFNLASLYYGGLLGSDCHKKGFYFAKRAADLGLTKAQLFIGLRFTEEKNWSEAFKYFELAAKENDTSSLFNLAICYENGYGTKQNILKATELYRCGAEEGHAMSQFYLGESYQHGSRGLSRNLKESLRWFRLAEENGHPEASSRIEHIEYEVAQNHEDEVLTIFESNTLLKVLQPVKNVIESVRFHKSSSMPSLQKLQKSYNKNIEDAHDLNNNISSFHGSMNLLNASLFRDCSFATKKPFYLSSIYDSSQSSSTCDELPFVNVENVSLRQMVGSKTSCLMY